MTVLWTPLLDVRTTTEIGRFAERYGFDSSAALQRWSVDDLEGFWRAVAEFFDLGLDAERVLGRREMPGAVWFPEARLNYAEHMVGDDPDAVAVVARSNTRDPIDTELRRTVRSGRASPGGPAAVGRRPGDRVVAYLPNLPETLIAFLATASLGAIWASAPRSSATAA